MFHEGGSLRCPQAPVRAHHLIGRHRELVEQLGRHGVAHDGIANHAAVGESTVLWQHAALAERGGLVPSLTQSAETDVLEVSHDVLVVESIAADVDDGGERDAKGCACRRHAGE